MSHSANFGSKIMRTYANGFISNTFSRTSVYIQTSFPSALLLHATSILLWPLDSNKNIESQSMAEKDSTGFRFNGGRDDKTDEQ